MDDRLALLLNCIFEDDEGTAELNDVNTSQNHMEMTSSNFDEQEYILSELISIQSLDTISKDIMPELLLNKYLSNQIITPPTLFEKPLTNSYEPLIIPENTWLNEDSNNCVEDYSKYEKDYLVQEMLVKRIKIDGQSLREGMFDFSFADESSGISISSDVEIEEDNIDSEKIFKNGIKKNKFLSKIFKKNK